MLTEKQVDELHYYLYEGCAPNESPDTDYESVIHLLKAGEVLHNPDHFPLRGSYTLYRGMSIDIKYLPQLLQCKTINLKMRSPIESWCHRKKNIRAYFSGSGFDGILAYGAPVRLMLKRTFKASSIVLDVNRALDCLETQYDLSVINPQEVLVKGANRRYRMGMDIIEVYLRHKDDEVKDALYDLLPVYKNRLDPFKDYVARISHGKLNLRGADYD